jgi:hypothetical protein
MLQESEYLKVTGAKDKTEGQSLTDHAIAKRGSPATGMSFTYLRS